MKLTSIIILFMLFLFFSSCKAVEKNEIKPLEPEYVKIMKTSNDGKTIISGQIIKKEFYRKNGKPTGLYEFYFRASVQDYYIKFCESKITKKELEKYLSDDSELAIGKGINVEANIVLNWYWDVCEQDSQEVQSRVGDYIVIHKIIK